MSSGPGAGPIEDEAAAWAVRLDLAGAGQDDPPELIAWLADDPRRAGALLRAQAALSFLDRGRALADADAAPEPKVAKPPTRRALLAGGAGLAAAGVAAAVALKPASQRYTTARGEIRSVPLGDGSVIAINTASELDVALHRRARNIRLNAGEAWFEVAKDPQRPFIVHAGAARVRAVGTAFSVYRRGADCDVLVTEGVVETWVDGSGLPPVRLPAGFRTVLSHGRPVVPVEASLEIERNLSWRTGQIVLDGQSLGEAAAQFNRYNARPILIDDPELARERFFGLFRTTEAESFAAAAAAALGARVTEDSQAIRLTSAR